MPPQVVRVPIQNAASVAGLLITTEAVVAELPEKNAGGGAGMPWAAAAWTSEQQAITENAAPGSDAGAFVGSSKMTRSQPKSNLKVNKRLITIYFTTKWGKL
jgi:hypothetical protein